MEIIARRPRDKNSEYIVAKANGYLPYVSAVASPQSLKHGEWFWGHYFKTEDEAISHFMNRGRG